MIAGKIVLVAPTAHLLGALEVGLRGQGYDVHHHLGLETFPSDGAALADAAVICAHPQLRVDRAMMEASPNLRAVVSSGTGIEGFELPAATASGILVANNQIPETVVSMAEATILVILASLYDLRGLDSRLRGGGPWDGPVRSRMAQGKTIGLIGFGQIARAVADRLQAWDVAIRAYAPRMRPPIPSHVEPTDLDDLLRASDIVCVLASLNAQSHHLLDARRLALTKPGSILINVARGAIIDEAALVALARTGHFARIALDAFETEPLPRNHPLRELPDTILTPHAIGHTREALEAFQEARLETIDRIMAGIPPRFVCNPEVLESWLRRWAPEQTG